MLTALKLGHILLPVTLAIIYIYFILLLNRYLYLSIGLIGVYVVLFVLFELRTYSILHFSPGKVNTLSQYLNCATDKIFEYKRNEEKIRELKHIIRSRRKHGQSTADHYAEFLERYQEPTYCDACECVRPSRAYHCRQCQACVLRREKHSELIGMCLGEGNLKVYIQYMFISMVTTGYMIGTLIAITVGEHHQLNDFSNLQLSVFAFEEIVLIACFLLFLKEFTISYHNAVDNITETERKQKILTNSGSGAPSSNPFSNERYYDKLFGSKLQFFRVGQVGDFNQWIEMHDEL